MSSPRLPLSSRPSFLPDEISRREFATVFRGFDPAEVRTFLNQLAEQAAEMSERLAEMQRSLVETEERVKNPELDEETVTKLLGSQTAQILRSARDAAVEIRTKAEDDVSRQLREAHEVTTKMKEEAEAILSQRTDDAEKAAASIKAAAEEESARIKSETDSEMLALRQRTQSDLVDERAKARQQIRDLVDMARAESQSLVGRTEEKQNELIGGLVRKRKIALAQVEELRAGRSRLLDAYKTVRTTLDEVTEELGRAEEQARDQATAAGAASAKQSGIEEPELDSVVELEQFKLNDDVPDHVIDLVDHGIDESNETSAKPGSSNGRNGNGGGSKQTGSGTSTSTSTSGGGQVGLLQREETVDAISVEDDEDDATADVAELQEAQRSIVIGDPAAGATEAERSLSLRREAVVSKARSQTTRRLKKSLDEEQDAVVAGLRAGAVESAESLIGSLDDQVANYQRSIVRLFREVVRTGASSVEGSTGVEKGVVDHAGTAAARELAAEVVDDLRMQLVPTIDSALLSGERDDEMLEEEVAQCYSSIKGEHLESLVADRVGGAFDQGVGLTGTTA